MTHWLPDISTGSGPLYVRLADAIETDIANGSLPIGEKLPPQRNLAYDIGVTIGTIGRGYQLAIERGLLVAEVGRGTFVRDAGAAETVYPENEPDPVDELNVRGWESGSGLVRMNSTSARDVGQAALMAPISAEIMVQEPTKAIDYVRHIEPGWQQAGARWMAQGGWKPDPNAIVPTQGAHAAMISIIAACTAPGDKIAFEDLTYASISHSVTLMGRRVVPVHAGSDGMDPDSLESVCAREHPKMLFVIPTLHNPTVAIIPLEKRKRIVEIARKYNVQIIEDNIYGVQVADAPPTFAELAPERCFHVSGLTKSVVAGLRAGWAHCPLHFRNRVIVINKSITGGISFLNTELAARMVRSGMAGTIAGKIRQVSAEREKLVRQVFAGCEFRSHPCASFFWLKLDDPWQSTMFKVAARDNNVLIDDVTQFKVSREGRFPHWVRIAFGTIPTERQLLQKLTLLRDLMAAGPAGYDNYS